MSNLKNNQYFTDDDIIRFINDAKDELFDVAVDANQHYFIKTFDFTLADGTKTTSLPTDFYKENLLEINPGTATVQTVPMLSNYLQRNQGYNALGVYYGPGPDRRYLIEHNSLTILGSNPNSTAGSYRLYYTPLLPDLAEPYVLDMAVPRDTVVNLITVNPLDAYGSWSQASPNLLEFIPTPTPPPFFNIDDQQLVIGDKILFLKDDAPITATNVGIWEFTGIVNSAGLRYDFQRPSGFEAGAILPAAYKIGVLRGSFGTQTTWITKTAWEIGTTEEEIDVTNFTSSTFLSNPNGSIGFYNDVLSLDALEANEETTFVGGTIKISRGAWQAGLAEFTITGTSGTTAFVTIPVGPHTPWLDTGVTALADTAFVTLQFADLSYELPLQLVPWALYIKVHASRTIRAARQQDTTQLDQQMAQLRQRVVKMAANRTEDVTQAPWLRRGRGFGGWSGGGM